MHDTSIKTISNEEDSLFFADESINPTVVPITIKYIKPTSIRYEGKKDERPHIKQNCNYGKEENELAFDNPIDKIYH